jgi:hypothetical protein
MVYDLVQQIATEMSADENEYSELKNGFTLKHLAQEWTTADFSNLSWHDNRVYALSFPSRDLSFYLDIDNIVEWVRQGDEIEGWRVAPARLIFFDVVDLEVSVRFQDTTCLYISRVDRQLAPPTPTGVGQHRYKIELDEGEISFTSTGFRQVLLSEPMFSEAQDLGETHHPGILKIA